MFKEGFWTVYKKCIYNATMYNCTGMYVQGTERREFLDEQYNDRLQGSVTHQFQTSISFTV